MLNTVAIVQARMASSRLPGKSLKTVNGRPMLGLLLERLLRCRKLDAIVVATGDRPIDGAIELLARQYGVFVVRGSEADVLSRFRQAMETLPSRSVVRICADNPLTDPAHIDSLVERFESHPCDYLYSNRPECGWPDGVGGEVIGADTLRRVDVSARSPHYREHVTSYLFDHPQLFTITHYLAPADLRYPSIRLDVDVEEDLALLRRICHSLPPGREAYWTIEEIVQLLLVTPDLMSLAEGGSETACTSTRLSMSGGTA